MKKCTWVAALVSVFSRRVARPIDEPRTTKTTHDFDDGFGAVPAHRHCNGGGLVADTAYVADTAFVGPDAQIYDRACVFGMACVYDMARVSGRAHVYDKACVSGEAHVYGEARVYGETRVYGEACVSGEARVYGEAHVYGEARVSGEARVYGEAHVYGEARVSGEARASRRPIVIAGGEYDVTITDTYVQIGCMCHPLSWWRENPAPEACPRLEAMRDAIVAIAEEFQK